MQAVQPHQVGVPPACGDGDTPPEEGTPTRLRGKAGSWAGPGVIP